MFKRLYAKQGFKASLSWVFPLLGVLAYVCAYFLFEKDSLLSEICRQIDEILIVSSLVGYITTKQV